MTFRRLDYTLPKTPITIGSLVLVNTQPDAVERTIGQHLIVGKVDGGHVHQGRQMHYITDSNNRIFRFWDEDCTAITNEQYDDFAATLKMLS